MLCSTLTIIMKERRISICAVGLEKTAFAWKQRQLVDCAIQCTTQHSERQASAGKFEIEEIYKFSRDDLLTEDMLILDTRAEVFVWLGSLVDPIEKQSAFEIGQKYVEIASSLEGLAPNVPLYKVAEGNEPSFFTTYFSWNPAKASSHGKPFQKKMVQIFGVTHEVNLQYFSHLLPFLCIQKQRYEQNQEKSNTPSNKGGPTQRASALNTAFNSTPSPKAVIAPKGGAGQGSQRAAAVAALLEVLMQKLALLLELRGRTSNMQQLRRQKTMPRKERQVVRVVKRGMRKRESVRFRARIHTSS